MNHAMTHISLLILAASAAILASGLLVLEHGRRRTSERRTAELARQLGASQQALELAHLERQTMEERRCELTRLVARETSRRVAAEARVQVYKSLDDASWLQLRAGSDAGFAPTEPMGLPDSPPTAR